MQSCTPIFHAFYGIEPLDEFDKEKDQKTLDDIVSKYSGPRVSYV